jgi:uncharacterized membrane protein YqjE
MLKENSNALLDTVSKLVEVNLELFKVEVKEEIGDWAIQTSLILVVLIAANMGIVFSSFAIAFLLGNWLNNYFFGFATVAIFYGIVAWALWQNRQSLQQRIKLYVQENLFEKQGEKTTLTPANTDITHQIDN